MFMVLPSICCINVTKYFFFNLKKQKKQQLNSLQCTGWHSQEEKSSKHIDSTHKMWPQELMAFN